MSNGNNIDDLFRQKLAGREVPYSEGAWAGADQLLVRHHRMVLLKKAAFFLIPAAIIAGGIGIFWNAQDAPITENDLMPAQAVHPSQQHTLSTTETLEERTTASFTSKGAASETGIKDSKISALPSTPETNSNDGIVGSSNDSDRDGIESHGLTEGDINPTKRSNNRRRVSNTRTTVAATETSSAPQEPVSLSVSNQAGMNAAVPSSSQTNGEVSNQTAPTIAAVNATSVRENMMGMPRNYFGSFGGAASDIMERESEYVQASTLRTWFVRANGGALIAQRLKNNAGGGNNQLLGFYAGLDGQWFFQPKVSLGLSAILHQRGALNSSTDLEGETATYNSALYTDIAANVHWNAFRRHTIGFGLAIAPLVDIRGDAALENAKADKKGFANIDAAGLLHYEWRATSRIDVMATLRVGAFDLTDDVHFETDGVRDFNHQLRLGLSYRLIQR